MHSITDVSIPTKGNKRAGTDPTIKYDYKYMIKRKCTSVYKSSLLGGDYYF